MPPLALIWIDLDESITHGQMDGRTDQRMDGQTLFQGYNNAFKSFKYRYPRAHGQLCVYTYTRADGTYFLTEGARKRA